MEEVMKVKEESNKVSGMEERMNKGNQTKEA